MAIADFGGSVLCFLIFLTETIGQSLNVTRTHPVGLGGANPLVLAAEDTENVTIFCELILDGSIIVSQWSIITETNPMRTFLSFTLEGGGHENFMVSQIGDFRRNFTILKFNSSLDNAQIGCGASGIVVVRFALKLASK